MRRRRWAGLLLGVLLHAGVAAEPVRLVTGDDYAPFTGRDLPGGGLLTQVVQAALSERAMSSTVDWQPWNRGYLKAVRGDYDATFPHVPSAQRDAGFLFSASLFEVEQHLFSRAEDAIELQNLATLTGRRLCSPLGWQPPPAVQKLIDQGQLARHSPQGLEACAQLLLLGRDDLFVADRHLGESALRATGAPMDVFHRSQTVVGTSSLHLIVPRSHPRAARLIEEFDQGLAALRARGQYRKMVEQALRWPAISPAGS